MGRPACGGGNGVRRARVPSCTSAAYVSGRTVGRTGSGRAPRMRAWPPNASRAAGTGPRIPAPKHHDRAASPRACSTLGDRRASIRAGVDIAAETFRGRVPHGIGHRQRERGVGRTRDPGANRVYSGFAPDGPRVGRFAIAPRRADQQRRKPTGAPNASAHEVMRHGPPPTRRGDPRQRCRPGRKPESGTCFHHAAGIWARFASATRTCKRSAMLSDAEVVRGREC